MSFICYIQILNLKVEKYKNNVYQNQISISDINTNTVYQIHILIPNIHNECQYQNQYQNQYETINITYQYQ